MKGLDALYLFKTLVDCGGISAASRRLNLPKSTLARRLNELEERLGLPLVHRGPRLALTNFGRECYSQCARIVRETDKVFEMADRAMQSPSGSLHIVCPPLLGSQMIEQLSADFSEIAPKVRLHLEETAWLLDPRHVSADLLIYASAEPLPDLDVIARRIVSAPFTLVAHPDQLSQRNAPANPKELANFDCIGFGPKAAKWAWLLRKGKESYSYEFEPRFSTSQLSAVATAVRRGLGIAALPQGLCRDDLSSGRLVSILSDWTPKPANIYVVYPSRRALSVAAEMFLKLVEDRIPKLLSASD